MIRLYSGTSPHPLTRAIVSFETNEDLVLPLPQGFTDKNGLAAIPIPPPANSIELFIDAPNHETMVLKHTQNSYDIPVPKLQAPQNHLGWWHHLCGINTFNAELGASIKIGIIDSGCTALPSVQHRTGLGTITTSSTSKRLTNDKENHGTAVASLIGARPVSPEDYAGMAPAAEILCVKVVPDHGSGADVKNQRLISDAIDLLIENSVHLINCSLGFKDPQPSLEHYLEAARDKGILCVCAAGNSGGHPTYPASSAWTASVAAVGDRRVVMQDTPSARTIPGLATDRWDGDYFVPLFSCPGKCIAPGVSVIAPDPARQGQSSGNRSKTGTSFAAPVVTGLLAAVLSQDKRYLKLPPERIRYDYARKVLQNLCKPFGFAAHYQGDGLPKI